MTKYLIEYGANKERFLCDADDRDHAIEQFKNAYPKENVFLLICMFKEVKYDFTVIWGNIGDDNDKRLDHVTVSDPSFATIMDAAFKIVFDERNTSTTRFSKYPELPWDDLRNNTPYDGYAILDGHITDSEYARFG